jgi:uncharacterized membrane protein SirB2
MQQKHHGGEETVATKRENKENELTEDFYDIIRACIETEKLPREDIQILLKFAELLKQYKNDIAQVKKKLDSSRSNVKCLSNEVVYYKKRYREERNKYIEVINENINQQKKISHLNGFLNKQKNDYHLLFEDVILKKKQIENLSIYNEKIVTELKAKRAVIAEQAYALDSQRTKVHFLCYLIIFIIFIIVMGLLFLDIDFWSMFKGQAEVFQTTEEITPPLEKLVNILTGNWLKYLSITGVLLLLLLQFYKEGKNYSELIDGIIKIALPILVIICFFSIANTFFFSFVKI